MTKYPIKDQVAIVGVGCTGYQRNLGRSAAALAIDACTGAIRDAGLEAKDIDGICATTWNRCPPASYMQASLGIPEVTWHADHMVPITLGLNLAMQAVFSGAATTVLVYHSLYRLPSLSQSAAADPFRARSELGYDHPAVAVPGLRVGYAGLHKQYLDRFGCPRDGFGLFAINARSNAKYNDLAAFREPLTMEDYLASRMVDAPMSMLDMDVPVDGADAFVVTTAERAKDLRHQPAAIIHASALGRLDKFQDGNLELNRTGHEVTLKALRERSDIDVKSTDIFMAYDGFSIIAMTWLENVGYCNRGEGGAFLAANWDKAENRVLIDGSVPINPHGGSLAEGGSQGAGHVREAAVQLWGEAGARQVPGASTVMVTVGAFLMNATALVMRAG